MSPLPKAARRAAAWLIAEQLNTARQMAMDVAASGGLIAADEFRVQQDTDGRWIVTEVRNEEPEP